MACGGVAWDAIWTVLRRDGLVGDAGRSSVVLPSFTSTCATASVNAGGGGSAPVWCIFSAIGNWCGLSWRLILVQHTPNSGMAEVTSAGGKQVEIRQKPTSKVKLTDEQREARSKQRARKKHAEAEDPDDEVAMDYSTDEDLGEPMSPAAIAASWGGGVQTPETTPPLPSPAPPMGVAELTAMYNSLASPAPPPDSSSQNLRPQGTPHAPPAQASGHVGTAGPAPAAPTPADILMGNATGRKGKGKGGRGGARQSQSQPQGGQGGARPATSTPAQAAGLQVQDLLPVLADLLRDQRTLAAWSMDVYLLPLAHPVTNVLQTGKEAFRARRQTTTQMIWERHSTTAGLAAFILQAVNADRRLAAMFPELVMGPDQVTTLVQALASSCSLSDRVAQYLETKPTKKGDKFLIKIVRGSGRIPPPASPTVLPGATLAEALTEVLGDYKVSGPAPQLAHERRIRAALSRPKGKKS